MSRDTSFYYSFLVLPPRKRSAIVAVWDFCRAVDDAVDEVVPESEWAGGLSDEARAKATAQVASWRDELDGDVRRNADDAAGQGAAAVHPRVQPAAREVRGSDRRRRDGSVGTSRYQTFERWSSTAAASRRRSA